MDKNIIKYTSVILLLISSFSAQSQQDAMFIQYMFNTASVNPAYTGSREYLNVMMIGRTQWVGMDGAPSTETLNFHIPIKKEKIALGFSAQHDAIGPVRTIGLYMDFSYVLKLGKVGNLSMGLKGGADIFQANLSTLYVIEGNDPAFFEENKKILPNFGFGLFYYTDKFYFGASAPKLLKNDISFTDAEEDALQKRHFFFIGGFVQDLNRSWKMKPSFLLKAVEGSPLSVDLTGSFLYKEMLWLGAAYRIGDAIGAIVQFKIYRQLWLGYSYDFSLTKLKSFNSGTHEIMLSYDLLFTKEKMKSPRFF